MGADSIGVQSSGKLGGALATDTHGGAIRSAEEQLGEGEKAGGGLTTL